MKKFEHLGRSLSKDEMKKVVGGREDAVCVDCGNSHFMCGRSTCIGDEAAHTLTCGGTTYSCP